MCFWCCVQTNEASPTEDQRQKLLECLSAGKAPCTYVKVCVLCVVNSVCRILKCDLMHTYQIVLGGEGRAGKTSTKNNLLGLGYNAESESTNGISISKADMSDTVSESCCHKR